MKLWLLTMGLLLGVMAQAIPADKVTEKGDKESVKDKAPDDGVRHTFEVGAKDKETEEAIAKLMASSRGATAPKYVPSNPPTGWTYSTTLTFNKGILAFLAKNVGKKVGSGQCAALAEVGLATVKAKANFLARKGTGHPDDYVWGTLVTTLTPSSTDASKVQPGDILQIRGPQSGPTFKGPTQGGGSYTSSAFHHTDVVQGVAKGKDSWWLMTYDQNVSNAGREEQWVHQGAFVKLKDMQKGTTIWVYRATK